MEKIPLKRHQSKLWTLGAAKFTQTLMLEIKEIQSRQKQNGCYQNCIRHTVLIRMATIFTPSNTTSGIEILLDKMTTLLKMINAFNAIAPPELLTDYLWGFDVDPFLPHDMLTHLDHRHRILVRVGRIEVRRLFVKHHFLLPSHFSALSQTLPTSALECEYFRLQVMSVCFGGYGLWLKDVGFDT